MEEQVPAVIQASNGISGDISNSTSIATSSEWATPTFEEVSLNCEVASYAPTDYEPERI